MGLCDKDLDDQGLSFETNRLGLILYWTERLIVAEFSCLLIKHKMKWMKLMIIIVVQILRTNKVELDGKLVIADYDN